MLPTDNQPAGSSAQDGQGGIGLQQLEVPPGLRKDATTAYMTRREVWRLLVYATTQMIAASNYIGSSPFLTTVNRMAKVVHVSPSMSVPMLHPDTRTTADDDQNDPRASDDGGGFFIFPDNDSLDDFHYLGW